MKYCRHSQILLFCLLVNIFIFLLLFLSQPGTNDHKHKQGRPKSIGGKFTVVIIEFEEFENDIPNTVDSILNLFPDVNILIVSKKLPYPPVDVSQDNVKVVVRDQASSDPKKWGDPSFYIKTKYVLLIPDSVRLHNGKKLKNFNYEKLNTIDGARIAAFPVGSNYQCSKLKVDYRHWTMSYTDKTYDGVCDAISGTSKVVLLLQSSHLANLSEPFLRPYPEGKELFTDTHKRWKADQKKNERLLRMYKRFGIKLINENGVENWYGCNKQTARCFGTVIDDMPEYIYQGRLTPPCCMRHLKETTRYVLSTLVKSGVSYWLEGGSLLGAVRNGDIIPWDYDVDIGIYQHEISKCSQLQLVQESPQKRYTDDQGFVWEKAREGEFFRVQFSETNHLHVDIFPFYEKNGIMTKNTWFKTHRQDSEFPAHYLKPLTTLDFAGIKASVPNNYREFLELKFGKGVIENPQFPNPKKMKKRKKTSLGDR
ncbi:fukutin-related protein-like isoform X2 [Dendronephthya gigantea]|uniref:fukutin-related protein-like isoform X2 n=1 Tax=Dendronephthya gigantea TaxID=151771 RepID=UPI00106A3722|nr:fukutin-related protein-like isoform X2 [Dendronephthya gigantea]